MFEDSSYARGSDDGDADDVEDYPLPAVSHLPVVRKRSTSSDLNFENQFE